MGKQHWVKWPSFYPTFGSLVSVHAIASSETAMKIQTLARIPSSDKRSRIFLLKLVVTKCQTKSKASIQY